MSDFDFDALRDPVAPQSGERERARVDARARELRSRKRLLAGASSIVALVVVVAIVTGGIVITRNNTSTVTVEGPSTSSSPTTTPVTSGASAVGDRFVPPTHLEDGLVVLPVTFPDGETTTLRYPPAMKIAQLGFAGGGGVNYPVSNGTLHCCGKQISITYATVADVYGNATPVHVYDGPHGEPVYYFHSSQAVKTVVPPLDFLVFQFGPWLVQVYDVQKSGDYELRMTDAQRATWARSLTGTTDANGYLLLHAAAPLSLSNDFDGGFGTATGNTLELAAHSYCNQPESDTSVRRPFQNEGSRGVSWCEGDLHVSASGEQTFVSLAKNDLQVTPLSAPDGTPTRPPSTTTTTTTPTAPATPAVSASFVSPDQGFVLEQNGRVDATTDGGATWTVAGSIGKAAGDGRIRFIGPSDGFAFDREGGALEISHDAGATWIDLTTPFTTVYDLAVLHGMIYVVGAPRDTSIAIGIWSTPVEHLVWKRDPLSLQHGAGPVTSIELVLAGSGGWILNVDRTVISGARLSANGSWAAWNPPCLGTNGPAFIAASTSDDLIASCDEGLWGGQSNPATTFYSSHDGGATFHRQDAPGFGPLASPSGNTAVLAGNGVGLQRTADDGATWNFVKVFHSSVVDIGFTTTTQGFAVTSAGQMLMTHDAGATWQAVTLP